MIAGGKTCHTRRMNNTLLAHHKRRIALYHWLLGRNYLRAARSMNINEQLFTGVRKDGVTPAFDHHISQAQYARTLPWLMFPEEVLCTIFYHDTPEDHGLSPNEILAHFPDDTQFGQRVADAVWRMTKKYRGTVRDEREIFDEMAKCPISSIAKGCDRIHNVQSMLGVFTEAKQRHYIEEVHHLFLPMLKQASRNFPEQECAYQNIRTLLRSQCEIVQAALDGTCAA